MVIYMLSLIFPTFHICLQGFPAFHGLRATDSSGKAEGHVPQAVATPCPPVAELTEKAPSMNLSEAVDAEELLKELDACGVRFSHCHNLSRSCLLQPSESNFIGSFPDCFYMQVGFIASLKNERKHETVSQVCSHILVCYLYYYYSLSFFLSVSVARSRC